MIKKIEVGELEKRKVTKLNNELFLAAKKLIENNAGGGPRCWHIGWAEIGDFIDWLEENYDIKKLQENKLNDE